MTRPVGKRLATNRTAGSSLGSEPPQPLHRRARLGGRTTRYDAPAVLEIIAGRLGELSERLQKEPQTIHLRWPELDFGTTGARLLGLRGATLLHVAAEFGNFEAADLLIARGADFNAQATVDAHGVGGQTPIFHAATQFGDWVLLEAGADLSVRATVPGGYETNEILECTRSSMRSDSRDRHSPARMAKHFACSRTGIVRSRETSTYGVR